jgi:hypothetical protein
MGFGYIQINVGTLKEPVWVNGLPRAVRLVGGPRNGEITDGLAHDYAEVTSHDDTDRTAVWALADSPGPASLPLAEKDG